MGQIPWNWGEVGAEIKMAPKRGEASKRPQNGGKNRKMGKNTTRKWGKCLNYVGKGENGVKIPKIGTKKGNVEGKWRER